MILSASLLNSVRTLLLLRLKMLQALTSLELYPKMRTIYQCFKLLLHQSSTPSSGQYTNASSSYFTRALSQAPDNIPMLQALTSPELYPKLRTIYQWT